MEQVYKYSRKVGITRSPEFKKKKLATHGLNVGLLCGHHCGYCSTPALIRTHKVFKEIGRSAFEGNYSIVDPETPERIRQDLHRFKPTDTVMLSTTTDAWSPEAQEFNLGRKCLELLLRGSSCQVRILTKNVAVIKEFDLIAEYRDRVWLSLSITAPPAKEKLVQILEPNASPISERLDVLKAAHKKGIRVYGMLCPCLPGIADDEKNLMAMIKPILKCGAKEVWLEPVNARGNGLKVCEERLKEAGEIKLAESINVIRNKKTWSAYARRLCETAVAVAKELGIIDGLRILMYPKGLAEIDSMTMKRLPGIVWLNADEDYRSGLETEPSRGKQGLLW